MSHIHMHIIHACCYPEKKRKKVLASELLTSSHLFLILEYLALFSLAMQFNFKAHGTKAIHLTPVFPAGEQAGSTAGTRKHILCLQVNLVALKVYTDFYTLSGLPKKPHQ